LLRAAGAGLGFQVEAMAQRHSRRRARIQFGGSRRAPGGRLEHAARLLGRPYSIDGRVVHGDKIGRQLGFHRQHPHQARETAAAGRLCRRSHGLPGGPHRGAANLGYRPSANQVTYDRCSKYTSSISAPTSTAPT
jgi:riboflavin kinase/FMN adenylyltransferase